MNAPADFNLSALMNAHGVYQVRRYSPCSFSVQLDDGRCASGATVGEALERASRLDAINVRKAA